MGSIEMGGFIKKILAYQDAHIENTTIQFEGNEFDNRPHEYEVQRSHDDKSFYFLLKQDGHAVQYPSEKISDVDSIIDALVRFYLNKHQQVDKEFDTWEAYFKDLSRIDKENAGEIEILAAWMEAIERIGLFSSIVVNAITDEKCGKPKSREKVFDEEIKAGVIFKYDGRGRPKLAGPLKYEHKYSMLGLIPDNIETYKAKDSEPLHAAFNKYLTSYFKPKFLSKMPHKRVRSAIYNEPAYIENLQSLLEKLPIPEDLMTIGLEITEFIPKRTNEKSDSNQEIPKESTGLNHQTIELEKKVSREDEGLEYLKKCVANYAKDRDVEAKDHTITDPIYIENPLGMGKTTLVKLLFKALLEAYLGESDVIPLPVFARHVSSGDFHGLLEPHLSDDEEFLVAVRKSCQQKKRKFVLILDGLDEVQNPSIRMNLINLLSDIRKDNILIIITSRPVERIRDQVTQSLGSLKLGKIQYNQQALLAHYGISYSLSGSLSHSLFSAVFDTQYLLLPFESPLFVDLIGKYFAEGDIASRTLPIPFYRLTEGFYKRILEYAKNNRGISPDATIEDVIAAGKKIAVALALDLPLRDVESDIVWLKQVGLIAGDMENPEFFHFTFYDDLLARAIASGVPSLNPAQVFSILKEENKNQSSVGKLAVQLAIATGTISAPQFDVFENLYEDNALRFSRLKALVWRAREKGPTPLLQELYNVLLRGSTDVQNVVGYLKHIRVSFPRLEELLFDRQNLDLLFSLGISTGNLPRLIQLIKNTTDENLKRFSIIPNELFKLIVRDSRVYEYILQLCPEFILDSDQIIILNLLFPSEFTQFYREYLNFLLKTDTQKFSEELLYSITYPQAYPAILQLGKNETVLKEILSTIFDNKKVREELRGLRYRIQEDLIDFLLNLLPLALKLQGSDMGNRLLETIMERGRKDFEKYLEEDLDLFGLLTNYAQQHPEQKSSQWLVHLISNNSTLLAECTNYLTEPNFAAVLLGLIYIGKGGFYGQGVDSPTKRLWYKLFKAVRASLQDDLSLTNLLISGLYPLSHFNEVTNSQAVHIPVWIRRIDLIRFRLLENTQFKEHMFGKYLTPKAQNYIITEYFQSILNKAPSPGLRENFVQFIFSPYGGPHYYWEYYLNLIENHRQNFSTFISEVINSPKPRKLIFQTIRGQPSNNTFNQAYWAIILADHPELKKDDIDRRWWEYLEAFNHIELPLDLQEKILASEELCAKFLEIPSPLQLANQTVVTLYNRIIAEKPRVVESYFKKLTIIQKKRLWDISYLLDQISKNFENYTQIFTLQEVINASFLQNCPETLRNHMLRDKSILRAILSANKKILDDLTFFLRFVPLEDDSINTLHEAMSEIRAEEKYFDINSHWFPEEPLQWIPNLQPDQSASIRKLQKQGINLENDAPSS